MRRHCFTWPSFTVAQHKNHCKCCCTSVDVHYCTTREVKSSALEQPTVRAKHPTSNGWVDNNGPYSYQNCICGELQSICSCACDECWRNHSEHHLKCKESEHWDNQGKVAGISGETFDSCQVFHQRKIKVADVLACTAERQTESDCCPDHADEPHCKDVLHEHSQNVFCSHHAAVEKGKPWCHECYESNGYKNPRCCTLVDSCCVHCVLSDVKYLKPMVENTCFGNVSFR